MRMAVILAAAAVSARVLAAGDPAEFGPVGKIHIYHPPGNAAPTSVVVFPSGDGGWEEGVQNKARILANMGALVIGFDTVEYLKRLRRDKSACAYPAGDFEALSQYVQHTLELPEYIHPVLVGFSSGATLAYVALAQSPPGTFKGAVSFGFCPDLEISLKFCRGHGLEQVNGPPNKGIIFRPVKSVNAPWVLLHGLKDEDCLPEGTKKFVEGMKGAELVLLPKVGHGFGVYSNWGTQFKKAFHDIAGRPENPVSTVDMQGLPSVVEVPADVHDQTGIMAMFISGDGGWADIDRQLSEALAVDGIPVVGLNSLKYFWQARTPGETTDAVVRIIRAYLQKWRLDRVMLVGYSRGADILPFIYNRLPDDLKSAVVMTVLVAPGTSTRFEIYVSDWIGEGVDPTGIPTLPEANKMAGLKVLCFHGTEEKDSLCPALQKGSLAECFAMPGNHHLGGRYKEVARIILDRLRR